MTSGSWHDRQRHMSLRTKTDQDQAGASSSSLPACLLPSLACLLQQGELKHQALTVKLTTHHDYLHYQVHFPSRVDKHRVSEAGIPFWIWLQSCVYEQLVIAEIHLYFTGLTAYPYWRFPLRLIRGFSNVESPIQH